jgi:hypothetical protein
MGYSVMKFEPGHNQQIAQKGLRRMCLSSAKMEVIIQSMRLGILAISSSRSAEMWYSSPSQLLLARNLCSAKDRFNPSSNTKCCSILRQEHEELSSGVGHKVDTQLFKCTFNSNQEVIFIVIDPILSSLLVNNSL